MKIIVGSQSVHKIGAVKDACQKLNLTAEISGIKASSNINEQPVGFEETFTGALNRANQARQANQNAYAIGIESGVFRFNSDTPRTVDMAIIVVIEPDGSLTYTTSSAVEFPEEFVEQGEVRGFETTTVGSVIAEKFGGDSTDPHSVITQGKVTRYVTLVHALVIALRQTGLFE